MGFKGLQGASLNLLDRSDRTYTNLEGLNETAWFEPIFENETFEVLGSRA